MVVNKYFYAVGKNKLADRVELLDSRTKHMSMQYISMFKEELESIKLDGRVGIFYVGGVGVHNAETSNYNGDYTCTQEPTESATPVIKSLQSYMMHKYAGILAKQNNIEMVKISGGTCASSMESIYDAQCALDMGVVDHAVVIAEEKTSFNTVRIFHEHNIDVKPGEGFACVVLSNSGEGSAITETKWTYNYNRNPFLVDAEGYKKVYTEANTTKGHKTGTEQNDTAEKEVFGEVFGYKGEIGHCQGASGLIEMCMVLDDKTKVGRILCTASGLGGFYGSCVVTKNG